MTIREPGFADFYFIGEHSAPRVQRPTTVTASVLLLSSSARVGLLPWTLLVPFLTCARRCATRRGVFCLVAPSVTIVAFSCAERELIPYIPAGRPYAGGADRRWTRRIAQWPSGRLTRRAPTAGFPDTHESARCWRFGRGVIVAAIAAPPIRTPYVMAVRPALYAIGAILVVGGAFTMSIFMKRAHGGGTRRIVVTLAFALIAGDGLGSRPSRCVHTHRSAARSPKKRPDADIICYHRYVSRCRLQSQARRAVGGVLNSISARGSTRRARAGS